MFLPVFTLKKRYNPLFVSVIFSMVVSFFTTSLYLPEAQADEMLLPFMPAPGMRVSLSQPFTPAIIRGMTIDPQNPFAFSFLVDPGNEQIPSDEQKDYYQKLIKYFLAAMTIAEDKQWVNLSPYEHNRIIDTDFGKTEMGRDLLAQDYMLKQITASLLYPEEALGKKFWKEVYREAAQKYGTTQIPVNTFNKVWILPQTALVYEKGNTVLIVQSHLRVMLEEDYLSLQKHTAINVGNTANLTDPSGVNKLGSRLVREIILPVIEKEVNEGKNFAQLRQIYHGMVLATWYKQALKKSILTQIYANKNKVKGVDLADPIQAQQQVYKQYLRAFKKGVYNYIKEDIDPVTQEIIPRKYFSGGFVNQGMVAKVDQAMAVKLLEKAGVLGRTIRYVIVVAQLSAANAPFFPSALAQPLATFVPAGQQIPHRDSSTEIDQKEELRKIIRIVDDFSKQVPLTEDLNKLLHIGVTMGKTRVFPVSSLTIVNVGGSANVIEVPDDNRGSPTINNLTRDNNDPSKFIIKLPEVTIHIDTHGNGSVHLEFNPNFMPLHQSSPKSMPGAANDKVGEGVVEGLKGGVLRSLGGGSAVSAKLPAVALIPGMEQKKPKPAPTPSVEQMIAAPKTPFNPDLKLIEAVLKQVRDAHSEIKDLEIYNNYPKHNGELFVVGEHGEGLSAVNPEEWIKPQVMHFFQPDKNGDKDILYIQAKDHDGNDGIYALSLKPIKLTKIPKSSYSGLLLAVRQGLGLKMDNAQLVPVGGIDLNSANLAMTIKRDGNGVPLPLALQDPAMLAAPGFVPIIIGIKSAIDLPILRELRAMAAP